MTSDLPLSRSSFSIRSAVRVLLLLVAAVFFALHAVHLGADFPNHSPWMDWSKYTDEGWYGDAAVRHFQLGHWYVPGDFNPAAALPVWPFLEAIVFHFTGVSLIAVRELAVIVFGLILVVSYLLILRSMKLSSEANLRADSSFAPAVAIVLLALNPFCYVFTRLAILEPLLILLTLLALFTASYLSPPKQGNGLRRKDILLAVLVGLLLTFMVLTKTTGIFLFPAIAWMLWARAGYRLRPFLRLSLVPSIVAATAWLVYYFALVRPHFLEDYQYLFSANAYTGITAATALSVIADTISDSLWMGRLLFPLALLATLLAVFNRRIVQRNPLIPALLFWAAGYFIFLAYHNNLQPRYYLVIAIPLTLLVAIVFETILQPPASHPIATAAIVAALMITAALDARQTLRYVRSPEYTFTTAAAQIKQIIVDDHHKDPAHNSLVLSISGSNLSLMTGLPSICDDFGTMQLNTRVATYHPGWFLTWNHVEDDKMDALAPFYQLQRIAEFPVMDDPERNLLILYRLDPPSLLVPSTPHRRRPIPRLLQTKVGQQPSETQLKH